MAHGQEMPVISLSPATSEAELGEESAHHRACRTDSTSSAVTLAQLRSRVEQQSSLIAMLKQRNDETFREVYKADHLAL